MFSVDVTGVEYALTATSHGKAVPQQATILPSQTVNVVRLSEFRRTASNCKLPAKEFVVEYRSCDIYYFPIPTADTKLHLNDNQEFLQKTIDLVESLDEIPNASRFLIIQAIQRRLDASDRNGIFDPTTWKPSEKYLDRKPPKGTDCKETIVEFLKRVWAPWIAAGELPLPRLLDLDPPGYRAVFTWRKNKGDELLAPLKLATRNEIAAKRINREQELPRSERSARTEWVLRSRRSKLRSAAPG